MDVKCQTTKICEQKLSNGKIKCSSESRRQHIKTLIFGGAHDDYQLLQLRARKQTTFVPCLILSVIYQY